MKTLIVLLLIVTTWSNPKQCQDIDILLVGDMSTSVRGHEPFIADAFDAFTNAFSISPDEINLGIVTFNTDAELLTPLTGDRNEINTQINFLRGSAAEGSTNMSAALFLAFNELRRNGRPAYRKLIIMISDGAVDNEANVLSIATQMKAMNIHICSVLIKASGNKPDVMRAIADHCYAESDYNNLSTELQKLDICL
jgi:uncharacterized protein YegL